MWLPAALSDTGSTKQEQLLGKSGIGSFPRPRHQLAVQFLPAAAQHRPWDILHRVTYRQCWAFGWPSSFLNVLFRHSVSQFFLSHTIEFGFLWSNSCFQNTLVAQLSSIKFNWYTEIAFTMHKTLSMIDFSKFILTFSCIRNKHPRSLVN